MDTCFLASETRLEAVTVVGPQLVDPPLELRYLA